MWTDKDIKRYIRTALKHAQVRYPEIGIVKVIDGNLVDIQVSGSPAFLRNVKVIGDPNSLSIGDEVQVVWSNRPGTPAKAPSVVVNSGAAPIIPSIATDEVTITKSSAGLAVKNRGIGLRHLDFEPALNGHNHTDMMGLGGWQVTSDGILYNGTTYIHPDGMIVLGTGNDILYLATEGDYRMWAGNASPANAPYSLSKTGVVRVGAGSPNIVIDGPNATIKSSNYSPGLVGWSIDKVGDAEFNNVYVRGALTTTVFIKGLIEAHAGTMIIAKSAGKLSSNANVADQGTPDFYVTVDDPPGGGFLFSNNDICRLKTEYSSGIMDVWFRVGTGVDNENGTQTYPCTRLSGTTTGTAPAGAAIVDYGQSGQGWLQMSADLAGAPYYDIYTHTGTPWTTGLPDMRVGNLASINDPDFGQLSGYGLYSQKAYLKGSLWAANGAVEISDSGIVINPGSGPESKITWVGSDANETATIGFGETLTSDFWGYFYAVANNASHKAHLDLGAFTPNYDIELTLDANDAANFAMARFVFNSTTELFRISNTEITFYKDILPNTHNTWDIGSDTVRVANLYVETLHATNQEIGGDLAGQGWTYAGDMYIKPESNAAHTVVYIQNPDATYQADLSVERNILVGGTVDGVDVGVFKSTYDTHVGNANAHHNRSHSITGSGDHTVTGNALDLIGLSATNTLGVITPSSSPGESEKILKTTADGLLTLYDLTVTNTFTATITGTDSDSFTIDKDNSATTSALYFGRTGGVQAAINWDGSRLYANKDWHVAGSGSFGTSIDTSHTLKVAGRAYVTDRMGIGVGAAENAILAMNWTNTSVTGPFYGTLSTLRHRVAGTDSAIVHSAYAYADTAIASGHLYGVYYQIAGTSTGGSSQAMVGAEATMWLGGSHNAVSMTGFSAQIQLNGTGTVPTVTGLNILFNKGGTTTPSNAYGITISSMAGIADMNYAIATTDGKVHFNNSGAPNGDVQIQGDVDSYLFFSDASEDKIGIGTVTPQTKLHIVSTAEQIRLGYDATKYASLYVSGPGVLQINSSHGIVVNDSGDDRDFRIESDENENMFFVDAGNSRIGIGLNNPSATLDISGTLKVSGTSIFNDGGDALSDFRVAGDIITHLLFVDASTDRIGFGTDTPSAPFDVSLAAVFFSSVVANESGIDVDFRVESSDAEHMLFVDASANAVGVNKSNPTYTLDVAGTIRGIGASAQLALTHDGTYYSNFLATNTGAIEISSYSGIILDPATTSSGAVLPGGNIEDDLGSYVAMWRSFYAAELVVQNFVRQDIQATIGGAIRVAPTTALARDLGSSDTTIYLGHSSPGFVNGTFIVMQGYDANGNISFEAMKLTSDGTDEGDDYSFAVSRNLDGTGSNSWSAGTAVVSTGDAIGEGHIDITSTQTLYSHNGPTMAMYVRTATTNWNDVKPVVAIGNLYSFLGIGADTYGMAIGNDLSLTTATFRGATITASDGLQLYNTNISLYDSATEKVSIKYNEGILVSSGSWGTDTTVFAAVFADDNEIAGLDAGDVLIGTPFHSLPASARGLHWDSSLSKLSGWGDFHLYGDSVFEGIVTIATAGEIKQGTGSLGSDFTGLRVWNDTGIGRIAGYNNNVIQWGAGTDGRLTAGAGEVTLDQFGIWLDVGISYSQGSAVKFRSGSTITGYVYGKRSSGSTHSIWIDNPEISGEDSVISIRSIAPTAKLAAVDLTTYSGGGGATIDLTADSDDTIPARALVTVTGGGVSSTLDIRPTYAAFSDGLEVGSVSGDPGIGDIWASGDGRFSGGLSIGDASYDPAASAVHIRGDGSSAGLYLGSTSDVQLYRDSANLMRTPDSLYVAGYVRVGGDLYTEAVSNRFADCTVTGWVGTPETSAYVLVKRVGKIIHVWWHLSGTDYSGTTVTIQLPDSSFVNSTGYTVMGACRNYDASGPWTMSFASLAGGSSTITVFKDASTAVWTASAGTRYTLGYMCYEGS